MASNETVTVGCKLPNGLILDVGDTRYTIAGTNATDLVGGHGVTVGIPKDFFDEWMRQHKGSPIVMGGYVFAHGKASDTAAEAREKEANRTGLEGLDPDKPGSGVQKADEQAPVGRSR